MTEIKKTIKNPPSRLAKKIISLSQADNWEEAKGEWKMKLYYYVPGHCSCLCSPRGVHNITVIENIYNSNQMYVCNPCADLYFDILESLKIESIVRRLRKNRDLSMDDICLEFLSKNQMIDKQELKNYKIVRLSRKDEYSLFYRQKMNRRIIHFTDYTNKSNFEKLDIIIAWSKKRENSHYVSVFAKMRKELADTGQTDIALLDDFIEKNEIEISLFTKQDRDLALEAIGEQRPTTLDLEEYSRTIKRRLTKDPSQHVLSLFCLEGLEEGEGRQEETAEDYEAMEILRDAVKRPWKYSATEQQDSQSHFGKEDNARLNKIIMEGIAAQIADEKKRAIDKERKVQNLKEKKQKQKERLASNLNQGNFDFIYPHGCDTSKWKCFHESVISPIDKDVLDELSYFIYTWFISVKNSYSLKSLIYFFTNREIAHKFKLIPYSTEFMEIMYVCALLQLIDINELGGILTDLYKKTDDNIKSDKVASLNEILFKTSYVATLKNGSEILITKKNKL